MCCILSHASVLSDTSALWKEEKQRMASLTCQIWPIFFCFLLCLMLSDELGEYFYLQFDHNLVKK